MRALPVALQMVVLAAVSRLSFRPARDRYDLRIPTGSDAPVAIGNFEPRVAPRLWTVALSESL
jgi:hypothetical protein